MIEALKINVEVACPAHPMGYDAFWRCGRRWAAQAKTKAEIIAIPARVAVEASVEELAQAYADGAVTEAALQRLVDEPMLGVMVLSAVPIELKPVVVKVEEAKRSVIEEIEAEHVKAKPRK